MRLSVDAISFSAHADFDQTSSFLDALRPQHVILVHGEATEMGRLRKALERQGSTSEINWTVHSPKVAQAVDVSSRHGVKFLIGLCSGDAQGHSKCPCRW